MESVARCFRLRRAGLGSCSSHTSLQRIHLLTEANARRVVRRWLDLGNAIIERDDGGIQSRRGWEAEQDFARLTWDESRLVSATNEKRGECEVIGYESGVGLR